MGCLLLCVCLLCVCLAGCGQSLAVPAPRPVGATKDPSSSKAADAEAPSTQSPSPSKKSTPAKSAHKARGHKAGGHKAGGQASEAIAKQPSGTLQRHTVRKVAGRPGPEGIPPVLLTAGHQKLCKIGVGQSFPAVTLPRWGGRAKASLTSLYGKRATVLLFWRPDRWMARAALADVERDVFQRFAAEQVAVVGIAVRQSADAVRRALDGAKATFPQLLDTQGQAADLVGSVPLPRLYVLDAQGGILWFDIEYSEGTRRELQKTLAAVVSDE